MNSHEIEKNLKRIIENFSIEKNLHVGNFYLIDGVMLYLKNQTALIFRPRLL